MEAPDPDPMWSDEIRKQWDDMWAADIAKAFTPAMVPALLRLFEYRQQWQDARLTWVADGSRTMVPGSRGNTVLHPMLRQMRELEQTIGTLEKQFGLTAYSAAKLGFKLGEAELTWAQLRRKEQEARLEVLNERKQVGSGLPVIDVT